MCIWYVKSTSELIQQSKDYYYFDHAYLFGNKHSPSKEIGEKIYRLTKNFFHVREIKRLNKPDYERIEKYRPFIKLKPYSSMRVITFCLYHLVNM